MSRCYDVAPEPDDRDRAPCQLGHGGVGGAEASSFAPTTLVEAKIDKREEIAVTQTVNGILVDVTAREVSRLLREVAIARGVRAVV